MVNIQQCSLGALEEYLLTGLEVFTKQQRGVGDVFSEYRRIAAVLSQDLIKTAGSLTQQIFQDEVLFNQEFFQLVCKNLFVEQIHQANTAPADLVLIAGTDTAAGSADLLVAAFGFAGNIDPLVVGHDHVQRFGQQQAGIIFDTT